MAEIALYAKDKRLVTEAGALLPTNARPIVRWREQDTFTLRLADGGEFPEGAYHYAFDIDRDFLETEPCNTGECEIVDGALVFTATFGSVKQAQATNNRRHPVAFYLQVTRDGHDYAEYVVEDAIWADGCVWDGRIPPAPEAPNYYTKTEVDKIAEGKLDKPEEAGEEGYVLGLAEDGSTAWIPNGGGGSWGHISGDLSDQTDLADALADKANLVGGKVPSGELPKAGTEYGAVRANDAFGIFVDGAGYMNVRRASTSEIDAKTNVYKPLVPYILDYAVRSVLPNVTTIPAATTAYSLLDASATTNNHSAHYTHAPTGVPTYTLPAVTDAAVAHEILLDVDFATVQACGFLDSQGAEVPLQSDITISAGDKWRFICVFAGDGWRVYPLPVEMAGGGGGGVPETLVVSGTEADIYAGTYSLTSDTMNDRPIWSDASNGKNIWAIQNGMDAGWYAWVVGGTPVAQAAGDTPMFYDFCTMDVDGLAALSASPDQSTMSWMHNMSPVQDTQFSVTEG